MFGDQNGFETASGNHPDSSPEPTPPFLQPTETLSEFAAPRTEISPVEVDEHFIARQTCERFWDVKLQRAEAEGDPAVRANRLKNIQTQKPWVEAFLEQNSNPATFAADADRIFRAIDWYANSAESKRGDFSGLALFGVETQKVSSIWGTLREISKFYLAEQETHVEPAFMETERASRSAVAESAWTTFSHAFAYPNDPSFKNEVITQFFRAASSSLLSNPAVAALMLQESFQQHADVRLAAKLGVALEAVPLPYAFFSSGREHGVLMPDSKTIERLNRAFMSPTGVQGFVFCCPDYAREQLPNGTFHYTMDGLGEGTGLTAQRALPPFIDMLSRLRLLSESQHAAPTSPVPEFRIGLADFEATPENAFRCGIRATDGKEAEAEFIRRLGKSRLAIAREIERLAPAEIAVCQISDEASDAHHLGALRLEARDAVSDRAIAVISIGGVTESFNRFRSDYRGRDSFDELVATEREKLARAARVDPETIEDSKIRAQIVNFQKSLDALLVLRLDLMLSWKTSEVPEYVSAVLEPAVPIENKAEVVRDLQQGLSAGDPLKTEALQYLREKVARQGAEYAVMHKLMAEVGKSSGVVHMVADAANMWQVFGVKSVPVFGIRGGYTGADVVDLG